MEKGKNPEKEQRTQYVLIRIGAWTGTITAEHKYIPDSMFGRGGYTSGYYLDSMLSSLVDGGYVVDETPLADDPNIVSYITKSPLCTGELEGNEIERLPEAVRDSARSIGGFMEGDFQTLASMMALEYGESSDNSAGMFDRVSAEYLAIYWLQKGARIGKKYGDKLIWLDGEEININEI